jgi:NAD+ synthase (glutamine-hydrolysing)
MSVQKPPEIDMNKRIALAQINPTIGDMLGNIDLMKSAAQQARLQGAGIVVFPELSLTAYYPGDLLDEVHFQERLEASMAQLLQANRETRGLYWIVGAPLKVSDFKEDMVGGSSGHRGTARKYFNSLLVLCNGEIVTTYRKQLLPTYGVFDELRHFQSGPDAAGILRVNGLNIGLMICEDAWNTAHQDYGVDPWERMAQAMPDVVISINASPTHVGKREQRLKVIRQGVLRHGLPLIYVNQVGGHDQLIYDGCSFAMQADGSLAVELPALVSEVRTVDVDVSPAPVSNRPQATFIDPHAGHTLHIKDEVRHVDRLHSFEDMAILGLRDYMRRCGFKKVLVGCSGGVDSAITLALATLAVGSKNVTAITMPSAVSSAGSVSDSKILCEGLGIELLEVPIAPIVDAFDAQTGFHLGTRAEGLERENLQPRIRATLLMSYSNRHGHLLLTTGNKSESMVGFCTIGGDTMGGLNLIGDWYKTDVFAVCESMNERHGKEIIPRAIIDKPPSAELAEGQTDAQRLPPYPELDAILKMTIEPDRLHPCEIESTRQAFAAAKPETIQAVRRLVSLSEYKRRQAPPIVRMRERAIGSGRQIPIAAKHF